MTMVVAEQSVTILGRKWLNDDIFELVCSRPEGFSFVAGQHVTMRYLDDERGVHHPLAPRDGFAAFSNQTH